MVSKTAWITGASSGIGEALAKSYFNQGYNVVLSARSQGKLEELAKSFNDESRVLVLPLDLSSNDSYENEVSTVVEKFSGIDTLVNNGGISQRSYASETNIDVVKKIMNVNFFGTVSLTNAVLKQMKKQNSGKIVAISSLVGKFGTPLRSSYSASKHALHGYFDSLRAELPETISVTIICPGFVKTNVSVNALTNDGSSTGVMDEAQDKAMEANDFAQKAISKIENRSQEAYIGGREVVGVYLKRFFPSLFAKIIRKAKVN